MKKGVVEIMFYLVVAFAIGAMVSSMLVNSGKEEEHFLQGRQQDMLESYKNGNNLIVYVDTAAQLAACEVASPIISAIVFSPSCAHEGKPLVTSTRECMFSPEYFSKRMLMQFRTALEIFLRGAPYPAMLETLEFNGNMLEGKFRPVPATEAFSYKVTPDFSVPALPDIKSLEDITAALAQQSACVKDYNPASELPLEEKCGLPEAVYERQEEFVLVSANLPLGGCIQNEANLQFYYSLQ